jgi:hypothetical protein
MTGAEFNFNINPSCSSPIKEVTVYCDLNIPLSWGEFSGSYSKVEKHRRV